MSGLPGSGKSYLARTLAKQTGMDYFNTDLERKKLFPQHRQYTEAEKKAVYAHLLQLAETSIQQKNSVIVDGTFYREDLRQPFYQLAQSHSCNLKIVYVKASEEVIRLRTSQPRPDSEANYDVYLKLKTLVETIPLPHLIVDTTSAPVEMSISEILHFLHTP